MGFLPTWAARWCLAAPSSFLISDLFFKCVMVVHHKTQYGFVEIRFVNSGTRILQSQKCNKRNLNVAWVRVDTHSILTIHNKVITRNYRIGLAQADGRNWDLKISNVAESDRGFYMYPVRYEEAYIEVVLPPDIIDSKSSTDTILREGSNVSLTCAASRHPQPHILWRREDVASITRGKLKSNSFDGGVLVLPRVSRLHIGAYLCIASNGVPPSVSKRIVLSVQFAPVLWIPNQLEGTVVGQQVSLVLSNRSLPNTDHSRFTMTITLENEYKMTMTLNIRHLSAEFFGRL
ncbi:hypothetical protein GHT06_021956 [Daphnia sinensis]|uniref:Ig-like domain-containing protein n=1 Tax=Daphnia sinensis TaxID=1820382 RepID=A0AAD5PN67_9CRUS|nr:hypothetical protein GHT06_021956 [Daphnia sinensis]